MIQRIQSLFLLLSAITTGLMTFNPLLNIEVTNGESGILFANAVKSAGTGEVILPCSPLQILISLITLISLLTIFIYKKRMLQMRLTIYNLILMVGLVGIGYYFAWQGANELAGSIKLAPFTILPVVAFILSLLAWRGIRRDYLMLKAVERIR